RDMLIDIHTRDFVYEDRINTSFGTGVRNGKSIGAGMDQMKLDMKENFGIEVDIPYDLSVGEWFYSDDDIHGQWLSFPSGVNRLDGYHAVAFGRHREYDSDLKRVKRQQLVVKASLAKVFSSGLLNTNALDLYDAYSAMVKTDIPKSKMPGYAALLKDTNGRMDAFSLGD